MSCDTVATHTHRQAERHLGDPEPGGNRSRGFWHGWCVYQMVAGAIPITSEHRALAAAIRARLEGERFQAERRYQTLSSPLGLYQATFGHDVLLQRGLPAPS
jgi:hypothetical protein